jgi:flagellar hook-associated protein 2
LQEGGLLKFNEATLMEKLTQDPTDVEDFFKGITTFDATSYSPNGAISAGELNFSTGDIIVNGKSVSFSSDPTATAEENAQAFRDAINQAGISGVVASLDGTGTRIMLNRSDGGEIEISGRSDKLSSVGFTTTSIYNEGNTTVGIFSKLGETLEGMLGDRGSLTLYENQLTDSQKRMQTERERTISQLDSKYQTMAAQFAAYDSIIANLNNQFSALQSMIDAEANK